MVLNAAQKAVLAKMPKEKQKEILKREKEKDKKRESKIPEDHILRKIIKERNDYEKMIIEKNQKISDQKFFLDMYYYIGIINSVFFVMTMYNMYYEYKHFIKIPKEGLKPGDTYTFTMPGP